MMAIMVRTMTGYIMAPFTFLPSKYTDFIWAPTDFREPARLPDSSPALTIETNNSEKTFGRSAIAALNDVPLLTLSFTPASKDFNFLLADCFKKPQSLLIEATPRQSCSQDFQQALSCPLFRCRQPEKISQKNRRNLFGVLLSRKSRIVPMFLILGKEQTGPRLLLRLR